MKASTRRWARVPAACVLLCSALLGLPSAAQGAERVAPPASSPRLQALDVPQCSEAHQEAFAGTVSRDVRNRRERTVFKVYLKAEWCGSAKPQRHGSVAAVQYVAETNSRIRVTRVRVLSEENRYVEYQHRRPLRHQVTMLAVVTACRDRRTKGTQCRTWRITQTITTVWNGIYYGSTNVAAEVAAKKGHQLAMPKPTTSAEQSAQAPS